MRNLLVYLITFLVTDLYAQNIYIKNINIFDGITNEIIQGSAVKIKGQTIEWIGTQSKNDPDGYEVIDGLGFVLMPGLIDSHTHISDLEAANRALLTGVTTVRTAGVDFYTDVALRNLAREGKIPGPDFICAGVFVTSNAYSNSMLSDTRLSPLIDGVNTEEELRLLVKINADRGVDIIKTRSTARAGLPETDPREQAYTLDQLKTIVNEASKYNLKVMVHAHGDEGGRAAVMAGAISIEHGTYLSRETLQLMKEKGTYLVPTIITIEDLMIPGGEYSHPTLELRGRFMMKEAEQTFHDALEIGVKIATGADNDYSETSTTRVSLEAEHFNRLGMTNFQALQTATINGAELLGLADKTGTLEVGKEADIILVPKDPLQDIMALQDVLMIISNGKLVLKRIPFALD